MKRIHTLFIVVLVGTGLIGSYLVAHTASKNTKKAQTTRKCNHGCKQRCNH